MRCITTSTAERIDGRVICYGIELWSESVCVCDINTNWFNTFLSDLLSTCEQTAFPVGHRIEFNITSIV